MPSKLQRLRLRRKAAKLTGDIPTITQTVRDWEVVDSLPDFEAADAIRKELVAKYKKIELAEGETPVLVKVKKARNGQFLVRVAKKTKTVTHTDYKKVAELVAKAAPPVIAVT